jgi:hypothetical protein
MTTFANLKVAAEATTNPVELFKIAKASNDKLLANIAKAKMLSYSHGRAAEAAHYFENVIPGWNCINNEIHALLASAMEGKTADETVAIVTEGLAA